MKRFLPVKVKVRVHDSRNKKTKVHQVPLTVNRARTEPSTSRAAATPTATRPDFIDTVPLSPLADDDASDKISSHHLRTISQSINWAAIRAALVDAAIEGNCIPEDTICCECNASPANSRCQQCGPMLFTCIPCCHSLHKKRNHFHTPEIWKDGTFKPLMLCSVLSLPPSHGPCQAAKEVREITVIDQHGNQHLTRIEFCECEKVAVTLLRYHLWPGSPQKPVCAFHLDLMELARVLFVHCKVSLREITEVINFTRSRLAPKLTTSIYAAMNSGSFEEYRFFHYQLRHLHNHCEGLYDGSWCPMCPKKDGVIIQSMDACFGLCRKKSKGPGLGDPKHKALLFADQDDVDNFVGTYGTSNDDTNANQDCNKFHAGEVLGALRSKGRNKLLDEKAVFGRVCRHDFPVGFINIKHGERISYSVYECKRLLAEVKSKENLKTVIMYDIGCILSSHIQKNPKLNDLAGIPLAIPIFHCYGHKASCQVQFNPRRTKSIGLTDGEGTERLWSFLRDYRRITKEMAADKRIDVLTDGLIHYGQQLISKQGRCIKAKMKKTKNLKIQTQKDIEELVSSLPDSFVYNDTNMAELMRAELEELQPKEAAGLQRDWGERYVEMLVQREQLRSEIANDEADVDNVSQMRKKLERIDKSLKNIEKQNSVKKRWDPSNPMFTEKKKTLWAKKKQQCLLKLHRVAAERLFLLEMKKKYADGQAIAIKIGKMLENATTSVKKLLAQVNALACPIEDVISFEQAKNPSSLIYAGMQQIDPAKLPASTTHRLIDMHCLHERCEEELNLLRTEAETLKNFYEGELHTIERELDCHPSSTDKLALGIHAVLRQKQVTILMELYHLKDMWGEDVIPIELTSDKPVPYEVLSPDHITFRPNAETTDVDSFDSEEESDCEAYGESSDEEETS